MQKRPTWILILLIAGVVAWNLSRGGGDSSPAPSPPAGAPDLLPAFAESDNPTQAAQDARDFAALCCALGCQLKYDATLPEPRIRTGVQMDDMRRWAREYFLTGESLGVKYPRLRVIVKEYLDTKLGTSGGPLDAAKRKAWIEALEALAAAGKYAADKL